MARKTKAELHAEREEALAAREAHEFAQYLSRLMAALELATTENNYELEVRNGMFSLRDRDSSRYDKVSKLTLNYTELSYDALENLEYDLQSKAEERAEQTRRYNVKQAALAKLTKEEKELLDLE